MKKISFVLLSLFVIFSSPNLLAQTDVSYQLSTHILDITRGKPAQEVLVILSKLNEQTMKFEEISSSKTNDDGQIRTFLSSAANNRGKYRLKFETLPYFENQNVKSIYPYVEVTFEIKDDSHYHIPIAVSANGYSIYRGS